jgi:hypothetical protein
VDQVRSQLPVSERRACAVVGQPRATQRRAPKVRDDEAALTEAIVRLAKRYGRYGYRRVRQLLVDEGWRVSIKRVYRIWRREGLKVPKKQPKRGRLWLNDGSCVRLRPERHNHVWSYDFVQDQTEDTRKFRILTVIDEFTRRCLTLHVMLITASILVIAEENRIMHHGEPKSGALFSQNAVVRDLNVTLDRDRPDACLLGRAARHACNLFPWCDPHENAWLHPVLR